MKKIIILTACLMASAGAYAQGLVSFGNANAINDDKGNPLGSSFQAELYAGATASSLSPIASSITAFVGGGFFFDANPVAIPGTTAASPSAFMQIAVWNPADGATYEAASTKVGALVGQSAVFSLATGGFGTPPSPPAVIPSSVAGFNLSVVGVPEPSTIALGLIGLGGLFLRRRK